MPVEPRAIALFRVSLRHDDAGGLRRRHPPSVTYHDGILLMDGEVDSLRAKRQALERAAALGGVEAIVDHLRVAPRQRLGDRQLALRLGEALADEPAFAPYAVAPLSAPLAAPPADGAIRFRVRQGVVLLSGQVGALDHKRLAGVLAWWVPGTRDVVNAIAVEPPEHEDGAGLAAAIADVLTRDHRLDAAGIVVTVAEDGAVMLSGRVTDPGQAWLAEDDAWEVLGVERVVNRLIAAG